MPTPSAVDDDAWARRSLADGAWGIGVVLVGLLFAGVVRPEYTHMPGVHDDHLMEWLSGERALGRLSTWEMISTSHSGQISPLGILMYDFLLQRFGPNSSAIGTFLLGTHACSAGILFLLLRQYLNRWGSLFAAVAWGSVALGRWDNTLLWRANILVGSSLLWTLVALYCLEEYRRVGQRVWIVVSLAAAAVSLAQWNGSLLLLPSMIWLWWLAGARGESAKGNARWMIGWLAIVGVGLALAWGGFSSARQGVPKDLGKSERLLFAGRIAPQVLAVAAADLSWSSARTLGSDQMKEKLGTLACWGALLILARPIGLRVAVVFLLTAAGYAAAVGWLRADLGEAAILTSGRYFTIPVLALVVVAGAVVDGVSSRWGKKLTWVGLAGLIAVLWGWYWTHQRAIGVEAVSQFRHLWKEAMEDFDAKQEVLRALAERGSASEVPVVVDLPLSVPPVQESYRISTLAAVMGQKFQGRVVVRPIAEMNDRDRAAARRHLLSLNSEEARSWHAATRMIAVDADAGIWLEQWAKERKDPVKLPPFERFYVRAWRAQDWWEIALGRPFVGVEWGGSEADRQQLVEELKKVEHPMARVWEELLLSNQPTPQRSDGVP